MRSPVRIRVSAPKKQSSHWDGCFFRFCSCSNRGPVERAAASGSSGAACSQGERRRPGSNPGISSASSQASHRLRRFFMLRIKNLLALVPLLLLSKSNRTGAPSLVDNFGSPLCWVLILYWKTESLAVGSAKEAVTPSGRLLLLFLSAFFLTCRKDCYKIFLTAFGKHQAKETHHGR